ncbi:hypothetical protein HAX54_032689, partial [Datura stramonium]|nr:hypothetical protein [Datura stramonium]
MPRFRSFVGSICGAVPSGVFLLHLNHLHDRRTPRALLRCFSFFLIRDCAEELALILGSYLYVRYLCLSKMTLTDVADTIQVNNGSMKCTLDVMY